MPTCAARGCKNRSCRGIKATFHIFPKNPKMRQKWIPVTGRKNWMPGLRAVLCSDHFEEPCFDRTGQTTRLRFGAIPTIGKFAPKNKKKEIFIKLEQEDEPERQPAPKAPAGKMGITTRSGKQLRGQAIAAAVARTLKKDLSENEVEPADPDDPPPPTRSTQPPASSPPPPPVSSPTPALSPPPPPASLPPPQPPLPPSEPPTENRGAEVALPDHFYCRTQNEMDALLKKSEQKKEEPPAWPQFRRVTLEKEAEKIKAMVKAGSKPRSKGNGNSEELIESEEQLKERLTEAEDLQRQIKSQQQKNRRSKKRSKAKFIRYVVMIEPTSKSGKKKGTAAAQKEGEEEETAKETEPAAAVEQVSSLQDSILSHTASMVVGPNGLLDEKDKQIQDLQKKLKIAKQKEKRKNEQLEHLQEVIEMLKEKCPEYSSQKELVSLERCSLCHSPLLKQCHRIAENLVASDMAVDQVSEPL
ncbi:proline-rich protein 12-like isoform X2 [Eriocheir sinensis]|uniref:proline-rich protein 12-like isoform X2 n=1 Tax=Eriocheir sinensis TaxID=95602 RepID=UPI0021C67E71|nr:proline-rich protein 12-like isoform X2 [Eriocheir sinensis]